MRWVGDTMSEHLLKVLPQHPVAAELARFEWALGLAFDAEDAYVVTVKDLAALPAEIWGNLRFALHPSVQLLDLAWNVIPVWQALDAEKVPPTAQENKAPCLVWRTDLNSHYRSLAIQEFQALQQIQAGVSFGRICEILFETLGEAATQQTAQYLASWLEVGIINQIKTN